ncbi:hypothetical protein [Promicromonospora sp. NPDC057488]|uniref:hypothetical protein n=1 Tax=Promicromonospora sp. NPDC057488 TaxID=3346147 RepID=UPI00366A58AB
MTGTFMQKAVTPQQARAYLTDGFDRVGGYVLRAADAVEAGTPAELYQAHGLGYPGTPHSPDEPVHTLWFEMTPQLRAENAVGGNDKPGAERTGGPFVEHPPFTGTGFAPWPGHAVPVYWLRHSRIPAGAELHRHDPDGSRTHVATYVDVATGWEAAPGSEPLPAPQVSPKPSPLVGPIAVFEGKNYAADVLPGAGVALCTSEPADGFEVTRLGRYRRVVAMGELDDLFEMVMRGTVQGLPVRAVDIVRTQQGPGLWVSYTGHVAVLAEGLGLTKIDAGLYEAAVAPDALADQETLQEAPTSWAQVVRSGR